MLMKIAFFVNSFPNFVETFILNQITGLLDRGHEVDIYALKKGKTEKTHSKVKEYRLLQNVYYLDNYKIPQKKLVRINKAVDFTLRNFSKEPKAIFKAINIFKYGTRAVSLEILYKNLPFLGKGPYDIIHCHFGWVGKKAMELKELAILKGKFITAFHGSDMSAYIKKHGDKTYNSLFYKGDLFLPISERWKSKLIEMSCDEQRIRVHRMGININEFCFSPRRRNKKIKLLTVGRLVEKKGTEYGIRAVIKILKKNPHVIYNIAGDGSLRTNLEKLVKEQEACRNIKFLGWQTHAKIKKLIQEANVMITPSVTSSEGDEEGIPVVLMEALASGLPVIASRHSGIPELVIDKKSGFLVPERDVDTLAEKLEYLIEHPGLWQKMGIAGRKYVEKHYDINKLNDRLEEIYKELIDEKI
jgi:colanic acid/amylovoran biosynthesis glycosyltransferase